MYLRLFTIKLRWFTIKIHSNSYFFLYSNIVNKSVNQSCYEKSYEIRNHRNSANSAINANLWKTQSVQLLKYLGKFAVNMFKTTTFSILWIDITIQTLSWARVLLFSRCNCAVCADCAVIAHFIISQCKVVDILLPLLPKHWTVISLWPILFLQWFLCRNPGDPKPLGTSQFPQKVSIQITPYQRFLKRK